MLTADQVTAIVPDAASLKAGRGLATPRKWELLGGDGEALWGLAVGSGKNPYQTRVSLGDLATNCSCPSRKFPCKHAIALMLIATGSPEQLTETCRPKWLTEWLDSRAEREKKSRERVAGKVAKPIDGKAAAKRREKRAGRVDEGVGLLRQSLLDLTREGLASPSARNPASWEELRRRMIDCQAPGLAGAVALIPDTVLRHREVDVELAYEVGRLFLLCESYMRRDQLDPAMKREVETLVGEGPRSEEVRAIATHSDRWFVAGRQHFERDRLTTSASWLLGHESRRWIRVLRFAHQPSTINEPWALGSTVTTEVHLYPGVEPARALPQSDGHSRFEARPDPSDHSYDELLTRFAATLAANPFLRSIPFLMELRPDGSRQLADRQGQALPWNAGDSEVLRTEAISGGRSRLACGEWDGRAIQLLALADSADWISLERSKQ